jgi:uncharacterized protein YdcH (DUF465 family)
VAGVAGQGECKENAARMDQLSSAENLETLRNQHHSLETRLAVLDRQLTLTTEEQAERVRLKKQKLAIKDRIQFLLAQTQQV